MKATVFLGGGRITSALVAGLRLAGYRPPIVVYDRHARKLQQLKQRYDVAIESDLRCAVEQAGILLIAVRPDSVHGLLAEIGKIGRSLIAVSLAAGVPLRDLRFSADSSLRWARAMPSPVCRYAGGLTALSFDRRLSQTGRQQVTKLFSQVGDVMELPERRFDAFTVTYSSSHGYHALAVLAEAAQKIGLDRKSALTAASHAMADGIVSWRTAGIPLAHLLHEAATPGGIAATVMSAMDSAGYDRIVEEALRAGLARARKNARKS